MPRLAIRNIPTALVSPGGTNNGVLFGNPTQLQITGAITISCWFQPLPTTTTNTRIVAKEDSANAAPYELLMPTATPSVARFQIKIGGVNSSSTSTTRLTPGTWYHISATYDPNGGSSNLKIYINGVLEGSSTAIGAIDNLASSNLMFLKNGTAGTLTKAGICEVRIWNTALTATEISNLLFQNVIPQTSSLVFYAPCSEGGGSTVIDQINGNNGTITGAGYSFNTPMQQRLPMRNFVSSVYYPGVNTAYALTKSGAILAGQTNLSISAWFYPINTATGKNMAIYSERAATGNDILKIGLDSATAKNKLTLTFRDDAGTLTQVRTFEAAELNRWHHVVAVKASRAVTVYLDGNVVAMGTLGGTDNFTDAGIESRIGGDKGDGNAPMLGYITDVSLYNTALAQSDVTSMYLQGTYPTTGLVSRWQCNEGSGTTLTDTQGVNAGSLQGTAAFNTEQPTKSRSTTSNRLVNRDFGTSLKFDGATAKVGSMTGFTRTAGQPFSAGIWFKTNVQTSGNLSMFCQRNGSAANALWKLGWTTAAGPLIFNYDSTGSGGIPTAPSGFTDGNWHHAVGVYDGSSILLYVDGVQVASVLNKPNAAIATTPLGIGFRPDTSVEFFRGYLDEAFISDQALSASEIQDIYYRGIYPGGKIKNLWHMNEGSGTTLIDSNSALNGTITAAIYATDVPMKSRALIT